MSSFAGLERPQSPRARIKGQVGSTGGIEEEGLGLGGRNRVGFGLPIVGIRQIWSTSPAGCRDRVRVPRCRFASVSLRS